VQPTLARLVEEGELPRGRRVNVRVIAAMAKDIDGEVKAGRVRAELRDALAVVRVGVPALRDRLADLPDLCAQMLRELGRPEVVDRETLQRLQGHRFPGNVRELKNILMRAVAVSEPGALQVSIDAPTATSSLRDMREQSEKDALVELLQRHGGNVSAAARAADVDRRHLHRLLKKHGLRGA
jgi:transcriptional regulator of acetoin/glycerol metabolism